jgi:hypothetical protein
MISEVSRRARAMNQAHRLGLTILTHDPGGNRQYRVAPAGLRDFHAAPTMPTALRTMREVEIYLDGYAAGESISFHTAIGGATR